MLTRSEQHNNIVEKSYDETGNVIITPELLDYLAEKYTATPVPDCIVCGSELGIVRAGGGNVTTYACKAVKMSDDDFQNHYGLSKWNQTQPGDPFVVAVVAALQEKNNVD